MTNTKTNKFSLRGFYSLLASSLKFHYAGMATWSIFLVLLLLSLLTGVKHESRNEIFMAGEIATNDIYAERTLRVEDTYATQLRREQTMALQPLIFDLSKTKAQDFRNNIITLLTSISSQGRDIESLTKIQESFNAQHHTEFDRGFFTILASPNTQEYLTKRLLPYAEKILDQGVFADKRQLSSGATAILVRATDTGAESLVSPSMQNFPDLNSFYLLVGQELSSSDLATGDRASLLQLIESLAEPTLTLNNSATLERAASVVAAIPPIYYYLQKGEQIVAEGDLVTREQQLKMQILYKFSARRLDIKKSLGVFIISLCLAYGLFFSPSSLTGSRLYPRVQYFMAFIILLFALATMLVGFILQSTVEQSVAEVWVFAFPLAGAAGISTLVFAARRFFSLSMILAFFATIFLKGSLALFFFFFLSAMLNTLLIIRSQSRSDVVTSTIILYCGQLIFALGALLFNLTELSLFPLALLAVTINTMLSLFLVFAISPLVEMFFNLTTRFRLMELMNLEQPLLQELMMTAPGTYHHSIIVSNLVEAGAKAINANSLLCKVAALYHDIGKIARPEYFIENQFKIANKHDTLAPAMSALIIISHVKHGVELAEKYNLGTEIIDLIKQHHGNRCISYFYYKAVNSHKGEGEVPQEMDYSYPYGKPQSREAALLMLADAIEASTRSLSNPTPGIINSHVKKIVQGIYEEGQLDESELTFRDLTNVSEAFARIVNGLFHQRIIYPEKVK